MVGYIHTNLPINATVRLLHFWSGDSHGQKTFLALSDYNRTHKYNKECSNHHPLLSTQRLKGLSSSKMKCWTINMEIYQKMPHSDGPILGANIARARKRFCYHLLIIKPSVIIKSAQTTIFPYPHKSERDWAP